jgi:hypothetical protein
MKKMKCLLAIAVACASLGFASQVSALTIGDSRDLGLVDPNHPADPTDSEGFVDILLSHPLSSGPTPIGDNYYTRTGNDPLGGVYPAADFAAELSFTGGSVDLGSGYLYLLAKYDGPNFGSEVWYVGGLTGTESIPLFGSGHQYGLSHVYVFNPGNTQVPDGGSTVALLGLAMMGLMGFRAKFQKT